MKIKDNVVVRKWLGYQARFTHTICLDCPKETCNGYCERYKQQLKEHRVKGEKYGSSRN